MPNDLAPDVAAFLDGLSQMPNSAFRDMSIADARAAARGIAQAFDLPPDPAVRREDIRFAIDDGRQVPARVYASAGIDADEPVIVYLHGGGWIVGDLDSYDGFCSHLSHEAGLRVVSIDYRLAPEAQFPAAFDDALMVIRQLGAGTGPIAVPGGLVLAGDSAGGGLAAAVAAEIAGPASPVRALLLFYPVLDVSRRSASYTAFATEHLLEADDMSYFIDCYAPDGHMRADPRCSPLLSPRLGAMPPTIMLTCSHDVLRDEGQAFADACREAGVTVDHMEAAGQIHGLVTLRGAIPSANAILDARIAALKRTVRAEQIKGSGLFEEAAK